MTPRRKKFLTMVTNDDGVHSPGIIELAQAVSKYSQVSIIGPETPQSAAGMSLTFHKPLRVNEVVVGEWLCYAISGSPADSIMVGVHKILPRRPDLVASGINIGDNVSLQDILASGTVAAALEAALMGIPAVAFSMEVPEDYVFLAGTRYADFLPAAEIAGEITREILEEGLPQGVDLLNVNFPWGVTLDSEIRVTTVENRKYKDHVLERKDPRGKPYYWLWGARLPQFGENSDANAIQKDHAISISPVTLRLSSPPGDETKRLERRLRAKIASIASGGGIKHK